MYFLCAANVLLKEFICLHSHGVLLLSIMFMASFALACAKKYQRKGEKEREREKKQPPVIVSINTNLCFYCLYLILFACVDGFLVVENHFHCSVTHQKTNLYAVILHEMKTSQADFPSRIYSTREIFRLGKCLCLRS